MATGARRHVAADRRQPVRQLAGDRVRAAHRRFLCRHQGHRIAARTRRSSARPLWCPAPTAPPGGARRTCCWSARRSIKDRSSRRTSRNQRRASPTCGPRPRATPRCAGGCSCRPSRRPSSRSLRVPSARPRTPYEKARAISTFFSNPANNFTYSLQTANQDTGDDLADLPAPPRRLLPAVRGNHGRHAAPGRGAGAGRTRLRALGAERQRHLHREDLRRALVGRGVLRRHRLGPVRPDAAGRDQRRWGERPAVGTARHQEGPGRADHRPAGGAASDPDRPGTTARRRRRSRQPPLAAAARRWCCR